MTQENLLIAGAGPTGLVLALWLAKMGIHARIVAKSAGPGTASRAVVVQARTLELYRQAGLTEAVIARGHEIDALHLWVKGEKRARVPFHAIGADLTPYPFVHAFPQDEHERLLLDRLRQEGVEVEWNTEVLACENVDEIVHVSLRKPDGTEEDFEAAYLIGCDGAHSRVRASVAQDFPGGTYKQLFYVADIEGRGEAFDGDIHLDLDTEDFLGVFGLSRDGRARLIGTIREDRIADADTLGFDDVSHRAIDDLKLKVDKVNWFSTYHVHHRVAPSFRAGRIFIAGDAAHIHSPAGGQGMNTGIGDAINLAWKLAAVLKRQASDRLLDSYEAERIGFARRLVETTDRVFTLATTEGHVAEMVRTRLAPVIAPLVMGLPAAREYLFRTVSQIMLNYRNSMLCNGKAGHIHGGDRLPWLHGEGFDNYENMHYIGWQVHVYGQASTALRQWCDSHGLPLHEYPWRTEFAAHGYARNALYLLRPDTYVALAEESGSAKAIERYFMQRELVSDAMID
ncbi:FAD-dependent monooxygenase [Noviherbaspirillum pedocola]|uniref:FAD-dependent monooxygenase n=1 Tax=Noviherbaspirillum pedocola TaxID=2801341 RepID=A0A934SYH9_9BURK|nr:FAD-dependent monooxygenase [Noviherbaspirillum pedocola]MBK4738067.1 FAD-dependent monooxygenase [Noviherbaspirillum pedocola]